MIGASELQLLPHRDASSRLGVVSLRWAAVALRGGVVHVQRCKQGQSAVHPLRGPELRAFRQLRHRYPDAPYVFVSERGGPLTARAARHIVLRAGQVAGLAFIYPHMLCHACGFYLANKGMDTRAIQHYLGHCTIQHTVRYTRLPPTASPPFGTIDTRRATTGIGEGWPCGFLRC